MFVEEKTNLMKVLNVSLNKFITIFSLSNMLSNNRPRLPGTSENTIIWIRHCKVINKSKTFEIIYVVISKMDHIMNRED